MCIFAVRVFLGILLCAPYQCLECPFGCECFAVTRTVKCVSKDLLTVPQSVPGYARTVIITGNNIHQIAPDSFTEMENVTNIILSNNRITEMASHSFSVLINLRFLDLSGNQLALIHPEALSIPGSPLQELNLSRSLYNFTALTDLTTALRWGGLGGLLRLDLSGNHLALLPPGMFSHLPNLQQLFLTNNSLVAVYSGTFSGMNHLEVLDLTQNAFRIFRADALQELEKLGNIHIHLGNNPYTCSCEIHNFVTWLNESRALLDVDAVRCASPGELTEARLQRLSVQAIGCVVPVQAGVADLTLQTSYVFLGLVLGFVGMVFLFVLYLNRKGMKNWIIEMRDACRDVMEGYHYRYEIDSDPRLGHITANKGGSRAQAHLRLALSQQLPNDICIVQVPTDTQIKQVTTFPPMNL
ncbi:trophoblast glycoprotein-like [Seriola lalandi dorsalis]|uniref:trophoblast glycoprotein-like n=1 Tax=Seriola lalandi dorsalis TaxID=1841481 RepID=UPI000C6F9477|nr:trophoblast glycoprotein-like [Seriola lalandi dorsalis]XP_056237857.1 trophoblast glycoprotein-like [Seriola aureovittata]